MAHEMLPFERLWPAIAERITPLGAERVAIGDALGRVVREPLRAAWDLPRFDASAMDGFAVRAADCAGSPPFRLALAEGDAYAGRGAPPPLAPGQALPIGTGGLLPDGADAIAIKEIARIDGSAVVVTEPVAAGAHVRKRGEELRAGETLLPAGVALGPAALAAAEAAGVREAAVGLRPRVAIVSTGSELVPPGTEPGPGGVVDTNLPFLERSIAQILGAGPVLAARVADDPEALAERLEEALEAADVVITLGGVSVGDRDYVRAALEGRFDAEPIVHKVAQKPGKPLYVARARGRWAVGLPGNPAAVVVQFTLVVAPLLHALAGAARPQPRRFPVRLATPVSRHRQRTLFLWVVLEQRDGALWAEPTGRRGSHMLSGLALADALVVVPPGEGALPAGAALEAIPLDPQHGSR